MHKPFCVWFTGLPCAGKSTLAGELFRQLSIRQIRAEVIDGDTVRSTFSKELSFTKIDREENNIRIARQALLHIDNGTAVICATISPYESIRRRLRDILKDSLILVFVNTPLETCMRRDVKGLYSRAVAGEIRNFTGVSDPYEIPQNADIIITEPMASAEAIATVLNHLGKNNYLP